MTYDEYLETPELVIADMLEVIAAEGDVSEEMRAAEQRR